MTKLTRVLLLGILIVAIGLPAFAQSGRGTITGIVKDPSGAVVPGADITITEKSTGVVNRTVSTEAGAYRAPYITPGMYRLTAALAGFKTAVADNIQVMVGQTVTVDFSLEVGQVSDQVTVMAETPLLETSTPEIGTGSTEKEVHTWPIIMDDGTRQLQTFIFNSMPGTEGGSFAGSINGGQSYSHEILIDGISVGRMDINGGNTSEFTPTIDAVSEFKLQTGALSSQYGNTQTALTNFGMKSGTNTFHGGAFWFHNEPFLNANSWANNARGVDKSGSKENNYGGTVGGPIWKDRTFFFFSTEFERLASKNLSGTNGTLPIQAFKNGDFSQLLNPAFTEDPNSGSVVGTDALGRPIIYGQIYDPATTRQLPDGTWIRDPFPGNVIPTSRFSSVTQTILQNYDFPAPPGNAFRRNQPWISGCCPDLNIDNYSLKIDQVLTNKHKMSGTYVNNGRYRWAYNGPHIPGPPPQAPMAATRLQDTPGTIIRFAEDWTLSPTVINHFAYGYNRFVNNNQSYSAVTGEDWAALLGLENVGSHAFPVINWRGYGGIGLGNNLYGNYGGIGGAFGGVNGSNIMSDDLTWIKGNHSLRFGWEGRWYYTNNQAFTTTGSYTFSNEGVALPGYRTSTGFTYAAFLLGETRSASDDIWLVNDGVRSRVFGFYVQDDWKARRNLTLNLGLRWDIPTALTEVRQRQSGLDPALPNPGADGFPGAMTMLGTCAGCNGKGRFADPYYKQFAPRVGFAWTPGSSNRLVVRGGYGINFAPPLQDGWNYYYGYGFNGNNSIPAYSNSRFNEDASYNWDNPFPPYTEQLPNSDPALMNDQVISWYEPSLTRYPMVQNWNFGVQYELPWQVKVEANYIGNRGARLNEPQYIIGWQPGLNQVPTQYLSLGDTLLDDVSDHPEYSPYPGFSGTVSQALRPFPQYYGVTSHRTNGGFSTYNGLQLTFTKRSTYGLSFLAAYTFSKTLSTADTAGPGNYYDYGQDWYNRKSDYSVTQYNYPQHLKLTWIYDLPFGAQGHWLKSGVLSYIAGGWTMSGIQNYQSGAPLKMYTWTYGYGPPLYNPGFRPDVLLARDQQTLTKPTNVIVDEGVGPYLNPAAFADLPSTPGGLPLHLGNAPRWQPDLRGFRQVSHDFSLIKKTPIKITEGAYFEIRMDAINVFNHVRISDPNTSVSDPSSFGYIFGKAGGPRHIQVGLRLAF